MKKRSPVVQGRLFLPIVPYSRAAYLVQSASHRDSVHLVDLEGYEEDKVVCTCPAFILGKVKDCPHIRSVRVQFKS